MSQRKYDKRKYRIRKYLNIKGDRYRNANTLEVDIDDLQFFLDDGWKILKTEPLSDLKLKGMPVEDDKDYSEVEYRSDETYRYSPYMAKEDSPYIVIDIQTESDVTFVRTLEERGWRISGAMEKEI